MTHGSTSEDDPRLRCARAVQAFGALGLCVLALAPGAVAATVSAAQGTSSDLKPGAVSATLEQCLNTGVQAERSATFAGEMAAMPGSVKMEMRIDVLERMPAEATFHMVSAPGLGVWRTASPGVKGYRYLKEVTNLAGPASYRALVRFRWLGAKGHLIKAAELRTPRCLQPAASAPAEETTPSS
jgi:hypothetical protein